MIYLIFIFFLMVLGFSCTIMCMGVNNPLSLSGLLLAMAILSAMSMFNLMSSSWFLYFFVLMFLGGVMVIILFMVSICPIYKSDFNFKNYKKLVFISILSVLLGNFLDSSLFTELGKSSWVVLFQHSSFLQYFLMAAFLIMCLFNVVSISKLESGPLVKRL